MGLAAQRATHQVLITIDAISPHVDAAVDI